MVPLKVRTMDGELTELEVDPCAYIYGVAQMMADLKKPGEKVSVVLSHEGQQLPPGCKVGECEVGGVLDAVWRVYMPPKDCGNCNSEVMPRREKHHDFFDASTGRLDVSGVFVRQGQRNDFAAHFPYSAFPSLRILDVRQCGLKTASLLMIFEKLPPSLEELWASRNHFTLPVLQCLQRKTLQLRALDIGYTECNDLTPLPDLVCDKTEHLILGDLDQLTASTFTAALSKCPSIRHLDIYGGHRMSDGFGAIAALQQLRNLEAIRVDCREEDLNQVLRSCTQLEQLYLDRTLNSCSIELLAKLENLKVLHCKVATVECGNQSLCEICRVQVQTLVIELEAENEGEDDVQPSMVMSENVGPVVEAFKTCVASCICLEVPSVDAAVLEAVGNRLCKIGPGPCDHRHSLLSLLVEMKHCCVNLISLSVNYWEQINGKQLAELAAACPLLQDVHLNADDCQFQATPIDEGILALGQHCHHLEHLDAYDRIMQEPAKTVIAASSGWPQLRYLCIANCTRGDWKDVAEISALPEALATNCPKLQEFVIYDDDLRSSFDPVFESKCPLYGDHLNYDIDREEGEEDE